MHRDVPSAASTVVAATLLATALCIACVPAQAADAAYATDADADVPISLSIRAQPLGDALNAFAAQAGMQLLAPPEFVASKTGPVVAGTLTRRDALSRLLAGSGLVAEIDLKNLLVVVRPVVASAAMPLPTVHVTADALSREGLQGYAVPRSRTATKTDTALLETPQSVSVIGRAEMDARGALDLMDIVAQTPGVSVAAYGPDNRSWERYIALRGFPGSPSSYRDGLPQTQFGVVYRMTESYGLERVDVLRGPSTVLFGQSDASGLINRVSKTPGAEATREIEARYGSVDRRQLAFDVGRAAQPGRDLGLRLVGLRLDSNDQERYPNGERLDRARLYLAPSLRWQPNASTSLTLFGELLRDTSGEDPYYDDFVGADGGLRRIKYGEPSFSGFRQDQSSFGYQFEHALNDAWTMRQNAQYTDIALERRALWAQSLQPDGHTISRSAFSWDDGLTQGAIDTQLQGTVRSGAVRHTLLFGLDWNRLEGTALRFRGAGPDLDLLNPVYGVAVPPPEIPLADFTQKMDQIALYAQDQIRLGDRWIATLGGRFDHAKTITDDRLSARRTRRNDDAFSSRVGVNYLARAGWSPYASYASYAESFLSTIGLDADDNPFKPSRGRQVEVGIKYQPRDGKRLITAALFDLRKTNVVTYDSITLAARQIGKQRSRGLELEAKTELVPALNLVASYTWLDPKVLESVDARERGKIPTMTPRQTASLWLDYAAGGGFGVGVGLNYVGKRQNDEANTSAEGGFTLLAAMVSYDGGHWRFGVNANNLLDHQYDTICYQGACYEGRARTVTFTAKYRF